MIRKRWWHLIDFAIKLLFFFILLTYIIIIRHYIILYMYIFTQLISIVIHIIFIFYYNLDNIVFFTNFSHFLHRHVIYLHAYIDFYWTYTLDKRKKGKRYSFKEFLLKKFLRFFRCLILIKTTIHITRLNKSDKVNRVKI